DAVGKMMSGVSASKCRKALAPNGTFVSVEMSYKSKQEDIAVLVSLLKDGKIKTVIDKTYPLEKVVEAHRYVEQGHKRGNVILSVTDKCTKR
ncbi:MAG: zinc-binding dehydrogenase, partial [Acidobacteria bacterium]|nr:zinc-binding dehydrogenase [Acidobacteriota bacterium]